MVQENEAQQHAGMRIVTPTILNNGDVATGDDDNDDDGLSLCCIYPQSSSSSSSSIKHYLLGSLVKVPSWMAFLFSS
jgi:hypothetical protein